MRYFLQFIYIWKRLSGKNNRSTSTICVLRLFLFILDKACGCLVKHNHDVLVLVKD